MFYGYDEPAGPPQGHAPGVSWVVDAPRAATDPDDTAEDHI